MRRFADLPFWKRAAVTNAAAAAGIFIGFASAKYRPSVLLDARIAVFTFGFMNLMLLVVAPRIRIKRIAGGPTPNPWGVVYEVLSERPFVTALVILRLWGVSRCISAAIIFADTSTSAYVRSMSNAELLILRLIGVSVLMACMAVLWLLGAIGLWRSRPWAWWLALVLNGLAAATGGIVQILKTNEFLLDPLAIIAVVLLLLQPVRTEFRRTRTGQQPIAPES